VTIGPLDEECADAIASAILAIVREAGASPTTALVAIGGVTASLFVEHCYPSLAVAQWCAALMATVDDGPPRQDQPRSTLQ
jgi:hypothetical protein